MDIRSTLSDGHGVDLPIRVGRVDNLDRPPAELEPPTEPVDPVGPNTYRISGIPLDWGIEGLRGYLRACDDSFDSEIEDRTSLATEPEGNELVATMTFDTIPLPLGNAIDADGFCSWKTPRGVKVRTAGTPVRRLIVDDSFIGITTLHAPSNGKHHFDILAISGLGSRAFGSFRAKGDDYMWLRDSLPIDFPSARIMIYGYHSKVADSNSMQNIEDLSGRFLADIRRLRSSGAPRRPIFFIGHSLGGILLKQAIIMLSESDDDEDKGLLASIYGLLFFGVPQLGMNIRYLIAMAGNGPNRALIESLNQDNSMILSQQKRKFGQALGDEGNSEVFCFYELRKSPTGKLNGQIWKRNGPEEILVNKESATCCRLWETGTEHICGLNRNHSNLVKFADRDPDYQVVRTRLEILKARGLAKFEVNRLALQLPFTENEKLACLETLNFLQMEDRFKNIENEVRGTCLWLLQHTQYEAWAVSDRSIIWIKGKPGSGKSTLMKFTLSKVNTVPGLLDTDGQNIVFGFFFYGTGDRLQKSLLGFWKALLHHFLRAAPMALAQLVEAHKNNFKAGRGKHGDGWEWHHADLFNTFKSALPDILHSYRVLIYVDALDEAQDEAGEQQAETLIDQFKELVRVCPPARRRFNICFSSRPYRLPPEDAFIEIDPARQNEQDIHTYVQQRLSGLVALKQHPAISELVSARADGLFMWARLVVPLVFGLAKRHRNAAAMKEAIEAVPKDLSDIYKGYIPDMNQESLVLFQWLCFAERPLKLVEMQWAMAIAPDCSQKTLAQCEESSSFVAIEGMRHEVEHRSCGLAEIVDCGIPGVENPSSEPTVRFIHQTAKDFFIREGLSDLESRTASGMRVRSNRATGLGHHRLAKVCVRRLFMGHEGVDNLFMYAGDSWMTHAKESDKRGICQDDLLSCFSLPSNAAADHYIQEFATWELEGSRLAHLASNYKLTGLLKSLLKPRRDRGSIDISAEVNSENDEGLTPLAIASKRGHGDIVKLLLDSNAVNANSWSQSKMAYMLAMFHNQGHIVRLLRDSDKVDVDLGDPSDMPPIARAFSRRLSRQGMPRFIYSDDGTYIPIS